MTKSLVKLLNRAEVTTMVSLSYPTIWKMMREGKFPRSVRLGDGQFSRVAWKLAEIEAWIEALPVQRLKGD